MTIQNYVVRQIRTGSLEEAGELVHRHAILATLELNRPPQAKCTLETLVKDKAKLIIQIARIVEMAVVEESRLLLMQVYLVFTRLRWAKVYNMQSELKRQKRTALTLVYR